MKKFLSIKQRRLNSILKRLNAWAEGSWFEYKEYEDFEGTRRYEFTNGHVKVVYFPQYEERTLSVGGGFWYGIRHHLPMKLARDITNFLYRYGK